MSMLAGMLLVLAPFLFCQEPQSQSRQGFPEDALSARQLIAWTWMQQPQPLPQPLPAPDKSIPPADHNSRVANPLNRNQILVGKIARSGDGLVLRSSDGNAYLVSGQDDLKQYEGKNVRISGILGTSDYTIQIVEIEILS